jgi:hypothetical protein
LPEKQAFCAEIFAQNRRQGTRRASLSFHQTSNFNCLERIFLQTRRQAPRARAPHPRQSFWRERLSRARRASGGCGGFGRIGHKGLGFDGDPRIITNISRKGKIFSDFLEFACEKWEPNFREKLAESMK